MPVSEKNDSDKNLPLYEALRQQARQCLQQAKEPLDHNLDPPFQLMLWGLDQGLQYHNPSYLQQLRDSVEYLAFQVDDPNQALKYLVEYLDNPQEARITHSLLQQSKNPKHASLLLLEALDSAMTADLNLPGWPPVYPKVE